MTKRDLVKNSVICIKGHEDAISHDEQIGNITDQLRMRMAVPSVIMSLNIPQGIKWAVGFLPNHTGEVDTVNVMCVNISPVTAMSVLEDTIARFEACEYVPKEVGMMEKLILVEWIEQPKVVFVSCDKEDKGEQLFIMKRALEIFKGQ